MLHKRESSKLCHFRKEVLERGCKPHLPCKPPQRQTVCVCIPDDGASVTLQEGVATGRAFFLPKMSATQMLASYIR